ncbi:MAG: diguanylate cyclase [Betaproteobacteria bacterium]
MPDQTEFEDASGRKLAVEDHQLTHGSGKSVLIVEDRPVLAPLLKALFHTRHSPLASVAQVESIGDAEKYLTVHPSHVVLIDLAVIDARGVDAISRVREVAPDSALLVVMDRYETGLAAAVLQHGAQGYLIHDGINEPDLLRAIYDAIERQKVNSRLIHAKERAEATLYCIGDAVVCTDDSGNISFLNLVAEQLTGWRCREAMGRPMGQVLRIRNDKGHEVVPNPVEKAALLNRSGHLPPDSFLIRRDETTLAIEDSIAPILDPKGASSGAVIVFRDVSIARATALEVAHSAQHDFLTGLPNRMLLIDRLSQAIAAAPRHRRKIAVLYLDLDGFKNINDSLGHGVGDKVLQSVAAQLVKCVRTEDTVSRQGGDEFVVLLARVDNPKDIQISVDRMLKAISEVHTVVQQCPPVSASIGVSVYPEDGQDPDTLIRNADAAMYRAKEKGRRRFQFFQGGATGATVGSDLLRMG